MRLLLDDNLSARMAERLETQADLLLAQLPAVEPDLDAGCIVAIGDDSIRVRSLPLGQKPLRSGDRGLFHLPGTC